MLVEETDGGLEGGGCRRPRLCGDGELLEETLRKVRSVCSRGGRDQRRVGKRFEAGENVGNIPIECEGLPVAKI